MGSSSNAVLVIVGAVDHHRIVVAAGSAIVFGMDDNGPTYWEGRLVVLVELMALEEEAGEDWLDGKCLTVRQSDGGGRGGHSVNRHYCKCDSTPNRRRVPPQAWC